MNMNKKTSLIMSATIALVGVFTFLSISTVSATGNQITICHGDGFHSWTRIQGNWNSSNVDDHFTDLNHNSHCSYEHILDGYCVAKNGHSKDTIYQGNVVCPGYCGDKIKNTSSEQCDDKDGVGQHQSCNSDCQLVNIPYCGDGIKNSAAEQCDGADGIGQHQTCDTTCHLVNMPYCGDGHKNQSSEQCDGTDGIGAYQSCDANCHIVNLPYCGDNIKNGTEECDGTDTLVHYSCDASCKKHYVPYCGDGHKNQSSEQCDGTEGVGTHQKCTDQCLLENIPYCGDKIVNDHELCDGNAQSCSTPCGYKGTQTCDKDCDRWNNCISFEYCGDRIKNGTEECDGANGVGQHQFCNSTCHLVNLPYCGDKIVNQFGEQCDGTDNCTEDCKFLPAGHCNDNCGYEGGDVIPNGKGGYITCLAMEACDPEQDCPMTCGHEANQVPNGSGGFKQCDATDPCAPKQDCPTTCGLDGSTVPDGNGGTITCDATLPCPINGGWSDWTQCTKTCGAETQSRICNNPAPQYDGNYCQGPTEQSCGLPACEEKGTCASECGYQGGDVMPDGNGGTITCEATSPCLINGGDDTTGDDDVASDDTGDDSGTGDTGTITGDDTADDTGDDTTGNTGNGTGDDTQIGDDTSDDSGDDTSDNTGDNIGDDTTTNETVNNCGNGVIDSGEQCDGTVGVGEHQTCSATCQWVSVPYCGDGIVNGTETCDDGNAKSGDGCSATCQKETSNTNGNGGSSESGNGSHSKPGHSHGSDIPGGWAPGFGPNAHQTGHVLGASTQQLSLDEIAALIEKIRKAVEELTNQVNALTAGATI